MKKLVLTLSLLFMGIAMAWAQDIKVESLEGEQRAFSQVIEGDAPVIVSFWATWCKPCLKEMEAIKELQEEWQGKVRVVSISIDDARSKAKVPAFVKSKELPFEIFMDSNQELFKSLGGSTVPFVFIYHKGKPVYKHSGYTPGDEEFLLEEALKYIEK